VGPHRAWLTYDLPVPVEGDRDLAFDLMKPLDGP
jgi:hypothetical protein